MITEYDLYFEFRRAQAESKNRPYRMPKNWDEHFENKMSAKNKEALTLAAKYFNTKWNKIDLTRFMQCGFELLKSFTYVQFFDQRIINLYIQHDKHIKRDIRMTKEGIIDSVKFVKTYMKDNNISSISRYCMIQKDSLKLVVYHYLNNKVDKYFIVWLMQRQMLRLTDDERAQVPYIVEQYRNIIMSLEGSKNFLDKIELLKL